MVAAYSIASFEKVVVNSAVFLIIPCYVHGIPLAVIHLYIIPHMIFGTGISRPCSADEHTGNIVFIAQYLECLCVALAYICAFSVEKRSGGVSFRRVAVFGFIVIVY